VGIKYASVCTTINKVKEDPKIRASLPVHERGDHESLVPRSLCIDGLVAECLDLRLAELELMPQDELRDDFRCREGWVVPDLRWRGVLLETVLALARPHREARHVQASAGNFSISIALDRAASALLAISLNGTNLSVEHGAPVRLVVPGGECFTSIKWLDHLEVRSEPGENTAETIALARLFSSCDPRRSSG
jgi:DMSO/TMAO reductase YedYZ molybdopterin-dependent catalytic subunit